MTTLFSVAKNEFGLGVYADTAIPAGLLLMSAQGTVVPKRSKHSIQIDNDVHVIVGKPMELLNHSCNPNSGLLIQSSIAMLHLFSRRPIIKGEQLTLDYASFEDEILYMPATCGCQSTNCRKAIKGFRDLTAAERSALGIFIAPYLLLADGREHVPTKRANR